MKIVGSPLSGVLWAQAQLRYRDFHKQDTPFLQKHVERFCDSFSKTENGCWLWTRAIGNYGYGRFRVGKSMMNSMRFAWLLFVGPIPEGMLVCHKCDVRACVNWEHLFLGTLHDNAADMVAKDRQFRGANHHSAKLNEELVRRIRFEYYLLKVTGSEIARSLSMDKTTICDAVNGKTWRRA